MALKQFRTCKWRPNISENYIYVCFCFLKAIILKSLKSRGWLAGGRRIGLGAEHCLNSAGLSRGSHVFVTCELWFLNIWGKTTGSFGSLEALSPFPQGWREGTWVPTQSCVYIFQGYSWDPTQLALKSKDTYRLMKPCFLTLENYFGLPVSNWGRRNHTCKKVVFN